MAQYTAPAVCNWLGLQRFSSAMLKQCPPPVLALKPEASIWYWRRTGHSWTGDQASYDQERNRYYHSRRQEKKALEKKDDTDTDSEEVDADMEKQCHQQGDDLRGRSHCTTWSRCEVEARRLYVLVAEGSASGDPRERCTSWLRMPQTRL